MIGPVIVLVAMVAFIGLQVLGCMASTRSWTDADWEKAYAYQRAIAEREKTR